jgi:hypothetical protein
MYCSFYLRNGVVFLPTMAKTEGGYWLGVEPVDVQNVETVGALQTVLLAAIARGNPTVPTPTREDFPRQCSTPSLPSMFGSYQTAR